MRPVIRRRGVTSNAGFATACSEATTCVPRMNRTSSPLRSSMGISSGSPTVQSI
jgi:hypothetical protein